MPRIPVYNRQVTPNASGAPAGMQGGRMISGTGQGLDAIGQGLDKIAGAMERGEQVDFVLEKDRIETEGRIWAARAASEADLAMTEHLRKSQESAPPGASGFVPSYLKGFDEYADGAKKNAPSQFAKQMIETHLLRSREAFGRAAMGWEAQESARFMGQQVDEGVSMSATLVAGNPMWFEREMGKWGSTIKNMTLPAAAKAKMMEMAKNTLATAAVKAAIDANPKDAMTMLDAWSKSQEPGKTHTVQMAVNGEPVNVPIGMVDFKQQQTLIEYAQKKHKEFEAKDLASTFIDAAKGAVTSAPMLAGDIIDLPKAKAAAVEAARRSGVPMDAQQQLQLENYVESVAADRERDVRRQREVSMAGLFSTLEQNRGDYQALVRDNPWIGSMPAEQRMRLNDYAGKVATGVTRDTDWQAYSQLVENPAVLKATNLDAMKDKFGAQEFAQLKKLQKQLNEDMPEQEVQATSTMLNLMLKNSGVNDKKKQAQFFSVLQSAVDQELAASGKKKLPQARVKELAADLLVKEITDKGVIFDSKDTAFTIKVPDTDRVKIEAALRESGLPVTEYNVLQAYRRKLRGAVQ